MIRQLIQNARDEFRALETSQTQLRRFGIVVGGLVAVVSLFFWWQGGRSSIGSGVIGAVLIVMGLITPHALVLPYRIWMGLAVFLGFFVGNSILIVLYGIVVTPIGLMQRLFGTDPLQRAFDVHAKTYWKPYEQRSEDHMRRPF